jgi:hypothetical protein
MYSDVVRAWVAASRFIRASKVCFRLRRRAVLRRDFYWGSSFGFNFLRSGQVTG